MRDLQHRVFVERASFLHDPPWCKCWFRQTEEWQTSQLYSLHHRGYPMVRLQASIVHMSVPAVTSMLTMLSSFHVQQSCIQCRSL